MSNNFFALFFGVKHTPFFSYKRHYVHNITCEVKMHIYVFAGYCLFHIVNFIFKRFCRISCAYFFAFERFGVGDCSFVTPWVFVNLYISLVKSNCCSFWLLCVERKNNSCHFIFFVLKKNTCLFVNSCRRIFNLCGNFVRL